MEEVFGQGLTWWITVIDLPALTGLLWMIWRTRKETEEAIRNLYDALTAFKLEAAKSYAYVTDLKDLEIRIVNHLLRIEAKLDKTALQTEALKAQKE